MRRFATPLSLIFVVTFAWVILSSAGIGTAMGGHRAALAWAILGCVAIATLAQPFRKAGAAVAIGGVVFFVAAVAVQLRLGKLTVNADNMDIKALVTAAVAFIVTPFVIRLMLDEV